MTKNDYIHDELRAIYLVVFISFGFSALKPYMKGKPMSSITINRGCQNIKQFRLTAIQDCPIKNPSKIRFLMSDLKWAERTFTYFIQFRKYGISLINPIQFQLCLDQI